MRGLRRTVRAGIERITGKDGTDITIDHNRRTYTGRAAVGPVPGACPHSHVVWANGKRTVAPCTGQAGHLSREHADEEGNRWG